MSRILLVEDEPGIASFIAKGLMAADHRVEHVADGATAATAASDDDHDLVILDLGLPGLDGLEVVDRIRARGMGLPIIVLSARSGVDDKVTALEAGANDYVTKPFRFEELLARINARLRDHGGDAGGVVMDVGGVRLDMRTRQLRVGGTSHELSAREFGLAQFLMEHPDADLSREAIMRRVWGYDHDPGSNVVDVYVGYLRRKVGHERIRTVRGVGYRFVTGQQGPRRRARPG